MIIHTKKKKKRYIINYYIIAIYSPFTKAVPSGMILDLITGLDPVCCAGSLCTDPYVTGFLFWRALGEQRDVEEKRNRESKG